MLTIWKYNIPIKDSFVLHLPRNHHVLTVQTQRGNPCIWVNVESENELVKTTFWIRGTGHNCEEMVGKRYIGTFQMQDGDLIFHLFTQWQFQ